MRRIFLIVIALSVTILADFSRNNGVVTDNKTSLQWQDDYSDNGGDIKYAKWTDAIAYCEDLTLDGNNDWRLPNKKELSSILDYGRHSPAINAIFANTSPRRYWSSTTRAGHTYSAWNVHFLYGSTSHYQNKSDSGYVRCVR